MEGGGHLDEARVVRVRVRVGVRVTCSWKEEVILTKPELSFWAERAFGCEWLIVSAFETVR
jgi:hypothetical protein